MKVYSLELKDGYETLSVKDLTDEEHDLFESIEKLENNWDEKALKVIGKGKKGDMAFCFLPMDNLIINEKVYELLHKELEVQDIELLPLKKGKDKYFILHGIKAYRMFHERVKKGIKFYHKFNEQELIELGINEKLFFRGMFNNNVLSQLFYTENFVELVNSYGLQGIDFEVMWDSENEL